MPILSAAESLLLVAIDAVAEGVADETELNIQSEHACGVTVSLDQDMTCLVVNGFLNQ
jgi:hypothetical protein